MRLTQRLWTEWTLAIGFLREGRTQSLMIVIGVAVGVAVIVFVTALMQGLQDNIIERTLGTQAHIRLLPPDERNLVLPAAPGTFHLVQENKRAQRLRSINNWQQVSTTLDQMINLNAVSPVVSGPAFVRRGEALESVALVGIDVQRYQQIIPLASYIVSGQLRVGAEDVVIGKLLADDLGAVSYTHLTLPTKRIV